MTIASAAACSWCNEARASTASRRPIQPSATAIALSPKKPDASGIEKPRGTPFAAKITMTPDGDNKAKVVFDVMDGQFTMAGTGTKK